MEVVSRELYERYREEVLKLSNSFQLYRPEGRPRGLSDAEIAERLGLDTAQVTQIRCIAELDTPPLDNWLLAPGEKRAKALKFIGGGRRYRGYG